ncbi:hypothetical protein MATL_G00124020 [Megalops atlanticus]|uniref:Uncharacterized protein n=1 Tax=Megalops atlanticus TaxID=7932 RepID=A0A9D3Q0S1_MEGAT|nr:hypothetical protein MATL_G00124020 [Megalops atlanticus]
MSRTSLHELQAHGNTALHMAAGLQGAAHQEEIIGLLLSHGADPSLRNLDNDQPIHLLPAGTKGERLRGLLRRGKGIGAASLPGKDPAV